MKYLKRFNESISSNEVVENLKDICRDLEDMNFEIEISHREMLQMDCRSGFLSATWEKYFQGGEYVIWVLRGTRSS